MRKGSLSGVGDGILKREYNRVTNNPVQNAIIESASRPQPRLMWNLSKSCQSSSLLSPPQKKKVKFSSEEGLQETAWHEERNGHFESAATSGSADTSPTSEVNGRAGTETEEPGTERFTADVTCLTENESSTDKEVVESRSRYSQQKLLTKSAVQASLWELEATLFSR